VAHFQKKLITKLAFSQHILSAHLSPAMAKITCHLMGPGWAEKSEIFDGSGVGRKI
jgi:hypothetical protein